jgi:hypothetical protein
MTVKKDFEANSFPKPLQLLGMDDNALVWSYEKYASSRTNFAPGYEEYTITYVVTTNPATGQSSQTNLLKLMHGVVAGSEDTYTNYSAIKVENKLGSITPTEAYAERSWVQGQRVGFTPPIQWTKLDMSDAVDFLKTGLHYAYNASREEIQAYKQNKIDETFPNRAASVRDKFFSFNPDLGGTSGYEFNRIFKYRLSPYTVFDGIENAAGAPSDTVSLIEATMYSRLLPGERTHQDAVNQFWNESTDLYKDFKKQFSNLYKFRSKLDKYVKLYTKNNEPWNPTHTFSDEFPTTELKLAVPQEFLNGYSADDVLLFSTGYDTNGMRITRGTTAKDRIFGQGQTEAVRAAGAAERAAAEERARQELAARIESIRITEQALLLNNLKTLSEESKKRRAEKPYDNFACIDVERENNVSDFATILTTQKGASRIFENLKPIHLSSMVPVVRVYGFDAASNKEDYYEYEFEEFTPKDFSNRFMAIPPQRGILGTSTGVNLLNFSWNFRGETPFLADKSIDCQMSIRAQSVDDLERVRYSPDGSRNYKFSNLFLPFEPEEKAEKSETGEVDFDPRKTRTRIKVQYKVDKNSSVWASSPELAKAVSEMTVELQLQLTYHTIEMNQDGTMKIDISFIGRYDAEVKDNDNANILGLARRPAPPKQPDNMLKYKRAAARQRLKKLRSSGFDLQRAQGPIRREIARLEAFLAGEQEEPELEQDSSEYERKRSILGLMKKIYSKNGLKTAAIDLKTLLVSQATGKKGVEETSLEKELKNVVTPAGARQALEERKEKG